MGMKSHVVDGGHGQWRRDLYFDLIIAKLISNYIKLNLLYLSEDQEPELDQHKAPGW